LAISLIMQYLHTVNQREEIMDFIKGFDRNQLVMMDFEANVGHDSRARDVDWFVDALPMGELGFNNVLLSEGRPPYKASDMLKLFMCGYKKDLRTSRKLEAACKINIAYKLISKPFEREIVLLLQLIMGFVRRLPLGINEEKHKYFVSTG